jgi:hypothetical protein
MSEMSKGHGTSGEQGDVGRRRLVRGAVALAPLVLTLRSGGLAAASAGAAVVAYATVDKNGNIAVTSRPNGGIPKVGDVCVSDYTKTQQDFGRISTGTVDTGNIISGENGKLVCGSSKADQQGSTQIQVAILSSSSTTSL